MNDKEISKENAIKIYRHIISKTSNRLTKKAAAVNISVMDYCNTEGEIVFLLAFGHHDHDQFARNCWDKFRIYPSKTSHVYYREDNYKTDKREGHPPKTVQAMQPCDSHSKGAEPVIVGIP